MEMLVSFCPSAFIDIQKVIDDVDLDVLEENLANVSLCDISQEMVRWIMLDQDIHTMYKESVNGRVQL